MNLHVCIAVMELSAQGTCSFSREHPHDTADLFCALFCGFGTCTRNGLAWCNGTSIDRLCKQSPNEADEFTN